MKNLVYLVSNGFALRMLTQTNLLVRICENNIKVTLLVQDENDPIITDLKNNNLSVLKYDYTSSRYQSELALLRRYTHEEISTNPALKEKHLKGIKNESLVRRVRYKLLFRVNRSSQLRKIFAKLLYVLENIYLEIEKKKHLSLIPNDASIISTYPANWKEKMFCKTLVNRGHTTIVHLLSWDNLTTKGDVGFVPNIFLAWGDIMIEEFRHLYPLNKTRIFKVGVPHFDIYYNNDFIRTNELIFVGMSSPYFAPGEIDIVERLVKWLNQGFFGDKKLLIRPHPQNVKGYMADTTWVDRIKRLEAHNVIVDWPRLNDESTITWSLSRNDMHHLASKLMRSAVVLNSGSTIALEGLAASKPVIITSFDGDKQLLYNDSARRLIDYPHLAKLKDSKAVTVVNNYEELLKYIVKICQSSSWDRDKSSSFLKRQIGYLDGENTSRVVDSILKVI